MDNGNTRMKQVYKEELHHFLDAIDAHSDDPRLSVPEPVVLRLTNVLIDDLEREEKNS